MAEEIVQDDPKLTVDQFATKLKTKYPEYKDIDNKELVGKMLTKYPEYESKVIMGDGVEKKPLQPASNSGSKPSYNGSAIRQNSLTGINQPNEAAQYAPLAAPVKEQQLAQDGMVRQARQAEQKRISDNLNKVLKGIDPKGRELMSKMASYNIEHPDMLTAPTQEEREHQDFMATPVGKVLGSVAYLGSKATKGTLQVAKGAAWLADNTIGAGSDKSLGQELNKLDKYTDYGLTKGDVANYDDSKALRNIGGLVELLPAIATGNATSNAAVFALQGMGQSKEVVDDLKSKGQKVDPWVEKAFVVGGGVISATLMGDLGRGLFSKIPANLRREIVSGITADAIKESAGKELTGAAFKDLLEQGAKKWSDKAAKFGVDALTHYKKTVVDLSKYNASNFALKKGVDAVNSSGPVFKENLGDLAESLKSVATEQAPFFAMAGQLSDIGKLTKYSSYKNDVVESLMSDPSEANVNKIKEQLATEGMNSAKQQWSPEELDATMKQVDNIATIASKLPRNISPSKLVDAVDLINGRDELVKRQEELKNAKQGFDESVRNIPSPEEELINNKVDQANDKLQEAVTGKRTKYEADEEKGKYTKTSPTGETTEISKSRYELEQLERQARRTERDEQVSKFQQNFPEYAVDVMNDLPNHVGRTFDRIESDKPTDIVQVNEASDWLYKKYKELQRMKDTDTRQLTIKQIDAVMGQLETDITSLEAYKSKNHPDAEPATETKPIINEPANTEPPVERGQPEPVVSEVPQPTEPAEVNNTQITESGPAATETPATEEVKPKNKSVKVESAKNENINAKVEAQGVEIEDTVGETRSNSVVNKEAGKAIRDGYDPRELVAKILKDKHQATDTEVAILAKHIDATEQRLMAIDKRLETEGANMSKADFDDLTNERSRALSEFQDVAQAARQTGTASARALGARRFEVNRDYSLANMITRKREANGGEKLSESQLTDVTNRFKELEAAQKALETKIKQLEADNSRLKADKAIKAAERTKRKSVTKEELATERKQIVSDFRSELAKIRKTTSAVAIPYARELAAAAPFVARMLRNLATEGVIEIGDVIKRVHEEFGTDIPDMTTDDVRDIIAGVYSEPRRTRADLEGQIRALKTQAMLLRKIEVAEAGLPKASPAKAKTISAEVEKLRERLAEVEKRSELPQEEKDLNAAKKRIQGRIDEITQKISNGDFEKKGSPQGLELDKEGLELRREYDRLKHEFDIEVAKEALQQRTKVQKFKDNAINILSLPRALKATLDFSAVLRQGLILGIGHPTKAVEALKQMFGQTFSQKKYDDWLSDIKHTPEYDLMVKSDLYISEKNNPDVIAREEEFTSNLAERIPILNSPVSLNIKGKVVKIPGLQLISGAERAYSAYLNAIRTGVFIDEAAKLQERGYTFENNPEQFKALAKVVNVLSGRGDIPEVLGGKQPTLLATALFSPRFMASRIQTLYLWADPRLPKEAKILAAKDLGKTLATAATIMTLAQLSGMTVEKDPRSTDFLKLKSGNTRYDILAGLAPYVVFLSQQISGKKKPTSNKGMIDLTTGKFGKPSRLTLAANFMRGKLAPVPGVGVNLLDGKDIVGQDYNYKSIPGEFVPLPISDIKGAADVGGWENSLKVLVPAIFGIGVSSYDSNAKKKPTWAKE